MRRGMSKVAFAWVWLIVGAAMAWSAPPSKQDIAKAIQNLGSNNFQAREEATIFLRKAGKAAEPALQKAARSLDIEVARRARKLLDDFKWGIYPDTPQNILALIERYRATTNTSTKLDIADQLSKLGPAGYTVLVKVAGAEQNRDIKQSLFHRVTRGAPVIVSDYLLKKQPEAVEELLELCLSSDDSSAQRNYAVYLLLNGQLDAQVKRWQTQFGQLDKRQAAEVRAYLYRADGKLTSALRAAEEAQNESLAKALQIEMESWKLLAKRQAAEIAETQRGMEALGYLAAYQRLAGQTDAFAKSIAELDKAAREQDESSAWLAGKALFLNDHTAEGVTGLLAVKNYRPAFDVLAYQLRYAQALAIADKVPKDHPQRLGLDMRRAVVLYKLGQRDSALQLFAKLADRINLGNELPSIARDLIRAETRLGLRDLAFAHTAQFLTRQNNEDLPAQLLGALFSSNEDVPKWWEFLRMIHKDDPPDAHLKRLRALFEAGAAGKDFEELTVKIEAAIPQNAKGPPRGVIESEAVGYLALAAGCRAVDKKELEAKYTLLAAKTADTLSTLQTIGDYYSRKEDWKQAAEYYSKAWEKDRKQPLPLFLHGWALKEMGQEKVGDQRMELAHWLPLANEQIRYEFADALWERGWIKGARRERDLILRTGPWEGWHVNETLRYQAYDAMYSKDYVKAAKLFEQFRLRCLQSSVGFVQYSAYVQVPVLVHRNLAMAAMAAGKWQEARQAAGRCLKMVPGNVDLPIEFVALLDEKNRKADGDAIFAEALAAQEKVCSTYPQSAASHNTLGWLSAICRRKLDKGLLHAKKAVELDPKNAGYHDTLAEVYFQMGNQAEAIKFMKTCIKLEPNTGYFKEQLKRIEAGDPKVKVPEH